MSEKLLHLVEHVVVDLLALVLDQLFLLAILNAQKIVSESWNHKELLHHGVHVANASQISQTNILLSSTLTSFLAWWLIVPHFGLIDLVEHWHQNCLQEVL